MNTIMVKGKHTLWLIGCVIAVIAKSVRYWLLNTRPRVQFLVNACKISGGRNVTGARFSEFIRVSPANHHSTIAPYSSSMCVSPEQVAQYHIISAPALGWLQTEE
jgi:hypothetical protein